MTSAGSRRTADTSSAWRGCPMGIRLFSQPTGLEPIRCGGSDATGGAIERVPGIAENVSDPVFARDGKRLAYSQFYIDTNIWRMDNATGESRQFIASTQSESSPQYSSDGKRVAFRSSRSGHNEIWVADVDSPSTATQLSRIRQHLNRVLPGGRPTARSIAADSRPDGPPDIFIIDASTGKPKQITTEASEDVVPSWSSDGNWIYFSSNRSGASQIWKTRADRRHSASRSRPAVVSRRSNPRTVATCTTRRAGRYQACGACLSRAVRRSRC